MANLCTNYVWFEGEEQNIKSCLAFFAKMIEKEMYYFPTLDKPIQGPIRDLSCVELDEENLTGLGSTEITIQFDSDWAPIESDIVYIAKMFNLKFEYEYSEISGDIYGKYTFDPEDGILYDQYLSPEEIANSKKEDNGDEEDYEKMDDLVERKEKVITSYSEGHE